MIAEVASPVVARTPLTVQVTDEELLLRFRDSGDVRAFEVLVHRYEREIYSYLRRFLGNETLAEDVFQQFCWRLHEKSAHFDSGARVRPWLYHMATNLAIDALRRAGRHKAVSLDVDEAEADESSGHLVDLVRDHAPSPLAQLEAAERRQWFQQAVEQLPSEMRGLVVLAFYQGMKYREIAEALKMPLGTVKSRLHKAFALLNAAWQRGVLAGTENDHDWKRKTACEIGS